MNRSLRLAFLVVLFAFATSVHAQNNCSTPQQSNLYNFYQTPPGVMGYTEFPDYVPCLGTNSTATYTVTVQQTASCINTNNSTTYQSSVRSALGNGVAYCTTSSMSGNLMCDPQFAPATTTATSPTDYNRFYIRVYDAIVGKACGYPTTLSRQDFWQCQGIACAPTTICSCFNFPYGCTQCPGTPIVLDLDGKGFILTSAEGGVVFDISGTGHPVQMGWTARGADNAFLALPGADGLVHNGKELFGNATPQPPSEHPNGFAALAVYDDPKNGGNGNGKIDPGDAIYSSLRLWIDANHDGICQPEELHTLASAGVTSISLDYSMSRKTDQYGNVFRYKAAVDPNEPDPDHVGRVAYDVFFVISDATSVPTPAAKGLQVPDGQKCVVPSKKVGMLSTTGTLR